MASSVPMAGGAVLQVDQAEPAHQTLLRHFRERCADANLDRHQRLRAGGDHQEETSSERVPAYAATDLSLTLFEKLPLKQAVAGFEPIETNPAFHRRHIPNSIAT